MIVRRRRPDREQYPTPSLSQKNSLLIHLLLLSRCLMNFGHLFWLLWWSMFIQFVLYIYDNGPSMWLKRHNGLNIPPLCCWPVPINPILDSSPCCLLSTIEMQLIDVHPPWRFRAVLKTLCSALCVLVHREGVGGCGYLDMWNNQINSAAIALSDKIVENYSALQI